jgi:hypothetical protein
VDRRVQLKNTEISGVLHADFKGLALESLKSYRQQLDAAADSRVADFQRRQALADQQEISEAKTRVDSQPTPIPALVDRSGAISNPGALVQGVSAPSAAVFASTASDMSKADRAARQALQSDIDRLKKIIEEDTRKAVDQIARRERWAVSADPATRDWTARVAAELRSQWSPTSQ